MKCLKWNWVVLVNAEFNQEINSCGLSGYRVEKEPVGWNVMTQLIAIICTEVYLPLSDPLF